MTDAPTTRTARRGRVRPQAASVPRNEAERLAELIQYGILDTGRERAFDELAELAAHLAGCPMAYVSLIDATRQWLKSAYGFTAEALNCPRELAFCADTILGADLLIVSDLAEHPRYRDYPIVVGPPHLRFYCGAPLITPKGYALGTLCVVDTVPHVLTEAQQQRVMQVAGLVVAELELRRKIVELDAAAHQAQAAEARLSAAHDQLGLDYKGMLNSMTDGVMTVTPDGRIGVLNATGAAILGREAEIMAGSRLADLSAEHAGAEEFAATVTAAMSGASSGRRHTINYHRRNGESRRLAVASALYELRVGPDAGRTGLVCVFSDVTEVERLRDSELQLNAALQEEHGKLQEAYRDLEESGVRLQRATRRMQIVRLVATLIVFLLFASAGAYAWLLSGDIGLSTGGGAVEAAAGAQTITVQPSPLRLQIATVGTIDAGSVVPVVAPFDGQIKEKMFTYGGAVERGRTLAVMDTGDLEDRLRDAQSALIKARQRMNELHNWSTGTEMSRARRAVATAQLDVDTLKGKLKETKMLLDKGIVSRSEYTDLEQQMRARQFQLDDAKQDLDATQARGDAETQRIAALELASAEVKVKGLEADLAKAAVTAPVSGVVLQPTEESSGTGRKEQVQVGTRVVRGQGIVTIGNLEDFTVKGSIDEIDINKIRVGQEVEVSSASFEGMNLVGKVTTVGAQAGQDPSGRAGMPVFPIAVAVDTTPEQRKIVHVGMSAELSIVTYDKPDAVVLPPAAVHGQGDHATVDVRAPGTGQVQPVPVKLGVSSPDGIEIRDGLMPGDVVVMSP